MPNGLSTAELLFRQKNMTANKTVGKDGLREPVESHQLKTEMLRLSGKNARRRWSRQP